MDYRFGTMFSSLCVTRLGSGDLGCCLSGREGGWTVTLSAWKDLCFSRAEVLHI